jgi:hypothetical protein
MNRTTPSSLIVATAFAACASSAHPAATDQTTDAAAAGARAGYLVDGGVDCNDYVNTPTQTVVRACVYEVPVDAAAAQGRNAEGEAVTVRVDGKLIASYGPCPCDVLPSIELVPAGSKAESYQAPTGQIRASDYDQSCSKDADCTETFEGVIRSGECHCPNAAINRKLGDAYQADFYAKRPTGFFLYQCDCLLRHARLPSGGMHAARLWRDGAKFAHRRRLSVGTSTLVTRRTVRKRLALDSAQSAALTSRNGVRATTCAAARRRQDRAHDRPDAEL